MNRIALAYALGSLVVSTSSVRASASEGAPVVTATAPAPAPAPIVVIGQVDVKPENAAEFASRFADIAIVSRKQPGNLGYSVQQAVDNPAHFATYEVWSTQAAQDAHLASPEIGAFFTVVSPMMTGAPQLQEYRLLP